MGELGLAAAFLDDALTLISPCSALLLPSFSAYAFAHPRELFARTVVFGLGLCATLVPLGVGSALVPTLFYGHRDVLITVAGWTIIGLGALQILGAVYGLAGFCSGPILGAVLTIAAADGGVWGGGLLLAVYALGMAAPMFVLALIWDRLQLARRSWLRGRPVRIGRRQLHSNQLISGALFVVIGWLFLRYEGTAGMSGVLGQGDTTDLEFEAQRWVGELATQGLDLWLLGVAAAVLVSIIAVRVHRIRAHARNEQAGEEIDELDREESR